MSDPSRLQRSDVEVALEAGRQTGLPYTAQGRNQYALVPDGHQLLSLAEFYERRAVPVANHKPSLLDASSFSAYVNRFKSERALVFADAAEMVMVAILDFSTPDRPGHAEHRAVLQLRRHAEFKRWLEDNGKKMDQAAFAAIIEERSHQFVTPAAAAMMEIASSMQVEQTVKFLSSKRLQDGQTELAYAEDIQTRAGKSGTLVVPPSFTISIPLFVSGPAVVIRALFRYRLSGGKLTLWYELAMVDDLQESAFRAVVADVEKFTDMSVLAGVCPK